MNEQLTVIEDIIAAAIKYSNDAVELLEERFGIELIPARWQDDQTDWRVE